MAAVLTGAPAFAAPTGGSGGVLTDRTNQTFTGSKYTSKYHIYASGLDWSKPVGMMIYADGSGEYGLKNPGSTYLLAGTDGLINVAKRNNMLLLTPFSPNTVCADGDGSCWYMGDSVGYAKWAEELVAHVQSQYNIEKDRVAFGGYSSGAQLATEWWVPSGAAQRTMTDGVIVAISYGGSPKMTEVAYDSNFKSKVHMNWNVGANDPAYTNDGSYDAKSGYDAYTSKSFATSIDVISGLGHNRSDFGKVMEAQIKEHVPLTGSGTPNPDPTPVPEPTPFATTVQPNRYSAKFLIDVPMNTGPATYVYVYWGNGYYEYEYTYADGDDVPLTVYNLPRNTNFTYKVFSSGVQKASGSFRTLQ